MNVELTRRWEQWVAGGAIRSALGVVEPGQRRCSHSAPLTAACAFGSRHSSEMESATIFILASIYRKRASAVNVRICC